MNAHAPNVFCRNARVTKSTVRQAISDIIRNIQGNRSDDALADILGCTGATISNARRQLTTLDAVTIAIIGDEFGVAAINPYLRVMSGRGVPLDPEEQAIEDFCSEAGGLVATYIDARHPNSPAGPSLAHTEKAELKKRIVRMVQTGSGVA